MHVGMAMREEALHVGLCDVIATFLSRSPTPNP